MGKSIGLYQGIALYIAATLGSGILFLSGVTASMAGPGGSNAYPPDWNKALSFFGIDYDEE